LLRSALWRLFASLLFAGLWSLSSPLVRAQRTCDQGCSGNPDFNTFFGNDAFQSNTTGGENTAIGESALFNNTTGGDNTAIGSGALSANTTGDNNTATGAFARAMLSGMCLRRCCSDA